MKKIFLLLAFLFASTLGAQNLLPGPVTVTNSPDAAGTPDFYVRPSTKQLSKMSWSNVLSAFTTSLNSHYYPLIGNPAGYLTTPSTLEFANLGSFPASGNLAIVYIAQDTGLGYSWTGSAYVPIGSVGISGLGLTNTLAAWSSGSSIRTSRIVDTPGAAVTINGPFGLLNGNSNFSIQRVSGQSQIDFAPGNPAPTLDQPSMMISNNILSGFELQSWGDIRFNTTSGDVERMRLLSTGNFGIGTASPSERLHVVGNLRVTGGIRDSANSIGSSGQVLTSTGGGTSWTAAGSIGAGTYVPFAGGTMLGDLQVQAIPASANSAISRNYLDNLLTGLTWKNAVKCKTTANHSLSGTANVDGVTVPAGTRVLVASQTLSAFNGIYISAAGSWTRATDCDSATELESTTVLVTSGTTFARTQWTQNLSVATIDTDPAGFAQVSGSGTYTNGPGLDLSANVFSIATGGVGNSMLANSSINVQGASVSLGGSVNPINGTGYPKAAGTTITYNASIPNADLANSSINVQGASVSLGGSVNPINGTGYPKAAGTTITYNASIPNADLANSSINVQGASVSLGGSVNPINGTGYPKAAGTTITYNASIPNADLATGIDATKINTGVVDNTEFNQLDGVTSPVQTQLDSKQSKVLTALTTGVTLFDDYLGNGVYTAPYASSNSGGGSSPVTVRTGGYGVVQHTTGTSLATGQGGLIIGDSNSGSYYLGGGQITFQRRIYIPTLSTSSERFTIREGFFQTSNMNNHSKGVFFLYDEGGVYNSGVSAGSANWKCITQNGTANYNITSVAVAAGTWMTLKIVINSAASSVAFYIDGTLIATNTTNIPGTSDPLHIRHTILKSVGTAARAYEADYFAFEHLFSSARN